MNTLSAHSSTRSTTPAPSSRVRPTIFVRFEDFGWCKGTLLKRNTDRRRTIKGVMVNFIAKFDIDEDTTAVKLEAKRTTTQPPSPTTSRGCFSSLRPRRPRRLTRRCMHVRGAKGAIVCRRGRHRGGSPKLCLCVYVVSIQWGRRQEAGPFGTFWNAVPAYTIRNVPLTWHS